MHIWGSFLVYKKNLSIFRWSFLNEQGGGGYQLFLSMACWVLMIARKGKREGLQRTLKSLRGIMHNG
jgi:hypothetical protein